MLNEIHPFSNQGKVIRVARQTEIMHHQLARAASLEQRYSDLVESARELVYVRQS